MKMNFLTRTGSVMTCAFLLLFMLMSACADPCKKVNCKNGGTCNDGDCNCKPGYSGSECQTEKTPIKIIINKIDVLNMPSVPSGGGGWDVGNGPDIFVKILRGTTEVYTTGYYENADVNSNYSFTLSPSAEITAPNDEYTFMLADYDPGSADDDMAGIYFKPYTDLVKGNQFPSVLEVAGVTGGLKFRLHVTYVF